MHIHRPWQQSLQSFKLIGIKLYELHKTHRLSSNTQVEKGEKLWKENPDGFFFFWFGFYGPFKNISLISSQSFIKGGRQPENPGKNYLTIRKQNLAFPHVTQARLKP